MVESVACLVPTRYAECSRAPDYINIGFLGRWGTYACPQRLPSDTVPIRSWTRTLRPPGIRHRHLPYHTIRRSCLSVRTQPLTATGAPSQTSTIPYHQDLPRPAASSSVRHPPSLLNAGRPPPPQRPKHARQRAQLCTTLTHAHLRS